MSIKALGDEHVKTRLVMVLNTNPSITAAPVSKIICALYGKLADGADP